MKSTSAVLKSVLTKRRHVSYEGHWLLPNWRTLDPLNHVPKRTRFSYTEVISFLAYSGDVSSTPVRPHQIIYLSNPIKPGPGNPERKIPVVQGFPIPEILLSGYQIRLLISFPALKVVLL